MISKRTVIVSGAGASAAYGFPLGGQMKSRIVAALASQADGSDAAVIAEATGAPMSTIQGFRAALERSEASSIDVFLEDVGEVYDVIGRCAIALDLLQLETDDRLFPDKGDWLGALFDAILRDPSAFRENFKLVTFNFDRSYERRLFLELAKRLPGTPLEADPYFDDVYKQARPCARTPGPTVVAEALPVRQRACHEGLLPDAKSGAGGGLGEERAHVPRQDH